MINAIVTAWRKNRLLTAGFLVLCLVTFFLILRLGFSIIYWSAHQNEPLRPWMRLGYISRSHNVEVEALRQAIGLPPSKRERRNLEELARDQGVPIAQLIQQLDQVIAETKNQTEGGVGQ